MPENGVFVRLSSLLLIACKYCFYIQTYETWFQKLLIWLELCASCTFCQLDIVWLITWIKRLPDRQKVFCMLAFDETKPVVTAQPQFRQSAGRFTQVNYQFALGSCVFEQRLSCLRHKYRHTVCEYSKQLSSFSKAPTSACLSITHSPTTYTHGQSEAVRTSVETFWKTGRILQN